MLSGLFIATRKNRESRPLDEAVFEVRVPSVDIRQLHSVWQVDNLEKQAFRRMPIVWIAWDN